MFIALRGKQIKNSWKPGFHGMIHMFIGNQFEHIFTFSHPCRGPEWHHLLGAMLLLPWCFQIPPLNSWYYSKLQLPSTISLRWECLEWTNCNHSRLDSPMLLMKFTEPSLFTSSDGNHKNAVEALFNFSCLMKHLSSLIFSLSFAGDKASGSCNQVDLCGSPGIATHLLKKKIKLVFPPKYGNRWNM